ncbi:MAG: threonylcarbamoyl-AMP synthase [Flavobacteriia bacterium]|nr:threonylcarbamoyl-AMP synthase [Flavobacteriia bacterium]
MFIEINPYSINERVLQQVVEHLKKGNIAIFPTDSVYNVACDLLSKKGLETLANFKDLKLNKARFSIICSDLSEISSYVKPISRPVFKILKHNLPGPFTFILQAGNEVQKVFQSNRKEIGIRIPDSLFLHKLVQLLGNPIATSSLHDEEDEIMEYFTDPNEIYQRYENQIEMIVDGGLGNIYPSTVVDCTSDEIEILRQGIGVLKT